MSRVSFTLVLAAALSLGACFPKSQAVEVDSTQDFIAALERAGAGVQPTTRAVEAAFGAPGQVLQINTAMVHVYEYQREADRAAISEQISEDGLEIAGTLVRWPARANIWARGRVIVVYPGTDGGVILLLDGLLGDPLTHRSRGGDEPFPPAVTAAIGAVAEALRVDPREITVLDYAARTWPDACLGYPGDDERCAAGPVDGWRIRLETAGSEIEVHSDITGTALRWQQE